MLTHFLNHCLELSKQEHTEFQLNWPGCAEYFPRLTYQVGEKEVVDLLSDPSNRSKRNDHGHEVLIMKITRIYQLLGTE